uniref:Actin-related protein 2/3 complex subunit 5 n=1 Tax=Anopheles funestus TaxID=62324 RepID=A0A182RUN5_ANOFN
MNDISFIISRSVNISSSTFAAWVGICQRCVDVLSVKENYCLIHHLLEEGIAMAKNTSSSAFRKIDVDQYNEDNFKEDDADQASSGMIVPDEAEINSLLNQYPFQIEPLNKVHLRDVALVYALKTVLQNAPLMCKNQQVKDNALSLTLRVLLSIKSSQIDAAIEALDDPELCDVLMKYIYRGFEIPSEGSSGHLLTWHEKVFAKGGVGSIVRVLSDSARA